MKISYYVVVLNLLVIRANSVASIQPTITGNKLESDQGSIPHPRFKDGDSTLGDINSFILNTEVGEMKSALNPSDGEQEVLPSYARATSFRKKTFLLFDFGSHPAENTISDHDGYWMSQDNTKEEVLTIGFEIPTKVDIVNILWRIPPTSFLCQSLLELLPFH